MEVPNGQSEEEHEEQAQVVQEVRLRLWKVGQRRFNLPARTRHEAEEQATPTDALRRQVRDENVGQLRVEEAQALKVGRTPRSLLPRPRVHPLVGGDFVICS